MAFDPITGMLIGGGISALGGILGGSSASKQAKADRQAAQEQRDAEEQQSVMDNYYRLFNLYGNEDAAMQALAPMLSDTQRKKYLDVAPTNASFTLQEQARLDEIGKLLTAKRQSSSGTFGAGNPRRRVSNQAAEKEIQALEAEKSALMAKSGGNPGSRGMIQKTGYAVPGGGLLAEYGALAGQSDQRTNQLLGKFDADTGSLLSSYDGLVNEARRYGEGQEERIRRDAGDQERRLNQNSLARLAASGLGDSTLSLQAMTGNSRAVNRDAQDKILNVNDSRIDRVLGLGSQRAGALGGRLNTRAGILGTGEDRFFQLTQQPLNLKAGVLLNPRMPNITPLSSSSPSAAFGGTIANSLGGIGGTVGGLSLQQYLTSQNNAARSK